LAYGNLSRNVTREEMIEAAKNANIHDFIQKLPQVLTDFFAHFSQINIHISFDK